MTSSSKREIRHFHVVVVQRRKEIYKKSFMHVQSCCFVNLIVLLFCRSCCCCRRHHRCLSSLSLARRPLNMTGKWSRVLCKLSCVRAYETWKRWQWIMRTVTCEHNVWGKICDIWRPILLPSLFSMSLKVRGDVNWWIISGLSSL